MTPNARPLILVAIVGCATIPESGGGGENLPNAEAGPFRATTTPEVGNLRSAPNVLSDSRSLVRAASVIDLDGDPSTLEVVAYTAAAVPPDGEEATPEDPTRAIVRYGALDGRSFDRAADVVLEADDAWEGGTVGTPAALRVGDEIWLFYAAAGGIGLARSGNGTAFAKEAGAVLAPVEGGWERGAPPQSPGVVKLEDGFRMFYEVMTSPQTSAIGEARSDDGIHWQRVGSAPVLSPSKGEGDAIYDTASVGAPFPIAGKSGDGSPLLRMYYAARDKAGTSTIGLAARFGDDQPFQRATAPVFGTSNSLAPTEPCVIPFADFTLLYVTQREGNTESLQGPAIAAGVAPGQATLPPPEPL